MDQVDNAPRNQQANLERQAIAAARAAYLKLPKGDPVFKQCIDQQETIVDVVNTLIAKCEHHKKRKSSKLFEKFQTNTLWLQNLGCIIDVAVQVQADIACPIWVPIKLVLKVSNEYALALDQLIQVTETIVHCLPRFELYKSLQEDELLQVALLNVFTDIVDFAVKTYHFFSHRIVRFRRAIGGKHSQELAATISRLEFDAKNVHDTAAAIELFRASKEREEAWLLRCEQWLAPANVRQIHYEQVLTRLDGTCSWIFSHPSFSLWMNPHSNASSDRILAISGISGCGKSILSSAVLSELEASNQEICFFPFTSSDVRRQKADTMIRTLLWQLLQNSFGERRTAVMRGLLVKGQPTSRELWSLFADTVKKIPSRIYFIVDGVDECTYFNEVATKMLELFETCSNCNLLLLGRPPSIHAIVSSYNMQIPRIEIKPALLENDIEIVITEGISGSALLNAMESRRQIFRVLKGKSEGMFLWLKLMIEDLQKASTKAEIIERLHSMPRGLQETYEMIFSRLSRDLDSIQLRLVKFIFTFLIVSYRAPSFDELRYAYALKTKSDETLQSHPLDDYLLAQPLEKLLSLCGGLVSANADRLALIHSTVKEFMIRESVLWVTGQAQSISHFCISQVEAHCVITTICLDYIVSEETALEMENLESYDATQSCRPFFKYAVLYTFYHFNRSGPSFSTGEDKMRSILKSSRAMPWIKYFSLFLLDDLSCEPQCYELEDLRLSMPESGIRVSFLDLFLLEVSRLSKDESIQKNIAMLSHLINQEDLRDDTGAFLESAENDASTMNLSPASSGRLIQSVSLEAPETQVVNLLELIRTHSPLTLVQQPDMLLKLIFSLRKSFSLTDPLKTLLRLILQKASSLPVHALMIVGQFYQKLQKFSEAIEVYEAAIERIQVSSITKGNILHGMGVCRFEIGQISAAMVNFGQAVEIGTKLLGKQHRETLISMTWIGHCHKALSQKAESLLIYRTVYKEFGSSTGDDAVYYLYWIGLCQFALGPVEDALVSFNEAKDLAKKKRFTDHVYLHSILHWIGHCQYKLKNYENALASFQMLYDYQKKRYDNQDSLQDSLLLIGCCQYDVEKFAEALATFQKVYGLCQENSRNFHFRQDVLIWIGHCQYSLELYEDALVSYEGAYRKDVAQMGGQYGRTLFALFWTGKVKYSLLQLEDALLCFEGAKPTANMILSTPEYEIAPEFEEEVQKWIGIGREAVLELERLLTANSTSIE